MEELQPKQQPSLSSLLEKEKLLFSKEIEVMYDVEQSDVEELRPKQQPSFSTLLEKEKLLFSKEIEVMYDVEKLDLNDFIEKELSPDSYKTKEILGELYFTTTK